jgi:chorismate dehydratase
LKLRVSLVHYLNAAPLGWSFLYGPHRDLFEVLLASPARCAEQLARGEADIGVIPSIEYQRIPNLRIIPGVAIAALNAVRSVIMVRHPGRAIDSVALDTNSRTSVELLKLLLETKMGLSPRYVHHSPDIDEMMRECDAALLIGDAALKVGLGDFEIMDLARAWVEWQQRPFVFAVWACRGDVPMPDDVAATFQDARAWGLSRREDIVGAFARKLNLPEPFLREYLTENVNYDMGPSHVEGLERFYSLACARGDISEIQPLRFLPACRGHVSLSR